MKKQQKTLFGLVLFINILLSVAIIFVIKINEDNNVVGNSVNNSISQNIVKE